ncbi:cell division protein FtsL [uncultured Shimia sp.]|uniref:cell division protein FtsL n=1 Tax=uncultured Shimia sp. TaxID=573152 RepID=UPI00260A5DE4|nr:cell division protein FtsL [uncultured Shimia sp.]
MRSMIFFLTTLAVIGLAVWAYRENYRTQDVIAQTERLQREIGEARSRLAVLRAEWAYLNRPDRLRDLAELNFDRLQLLQLRPDQFGKIDQVSYPPAEKIDFTGVVDVSSQTDAEDWP